MRRLGHATKRIYRAWLYSGLNEKALAINAACQPEASARSASAPITGASSREYWDVR